MNELLGLPIAALTPSALLGIVVLLILTGRLVPRRTYDDLLKSNQTKDLQIAEKDKQIAHLTQVGLTTEAVMRALQQAQHETQHPGVHDEEAPA